MRLQVLNQDLRFTCTFRAGNTTDVPKLEWSGEFTEHRQIIADAFAAQARGEGLILVAAVDDFPVAQIWVKFSPGHPPRLWAFRVMRRFQRMGLGSRLLRFAEDILAKRNFEVCEIGAEKWNREARKFYEHMGYQLACEQVEEYSYTTPEGELRTGAPDQWIFCRVLASANAADDVTSNPQRRQQDQPDRTGPPGGQSSAPAGPR
jgi:GNAT superfamily N-acetyltransferase